MQDEDSLIDYLTGMGNDTRGKIIVTVPRISGTLSILGSAAIIHVIVMNRKKMFPHANNRMMLVMSVFDLFSSFALAMSSTLTPQNSATYGAMGNTLTCNAQGFLLQIGITVPFYNAAISLYYLLIIKYNYGKRRFSTRIEPYIHAICILVPLSTAITSLALGLFNFKGGLCWIEPYPWLCKLTGEECTRGINAHLFELFFAGIFIAAGFVFNVFSMSAIYIHIRQRENSMRRYVFRRSKSFVSNQFSNDKRETAIQAFLITAPFFMTFIIPSMHVLMAIWGVKYTHWSILVLQGFFFPLQGFWNFIVFSRPHITKIITKNPNKSFIWALCTFLGILRSTEDKEESDDNRDRKKLARLWAELRQSSHMVKTETFHKEFKWEEKIQFEESNKKEKRRNDADCKADSLAILDLFSDDFTTFVNELGNLELSKECIKDDISLIFNPETDDLPVNKPAF